METDLIHVPEVHEATLVYRATPVRQRPHVHSSKQAYELLLPWFDDAMDLREEFRVLLLDRGNKVKAVYCVSQGGMHSTTADPKIIFCAALKGLAAAIVLAHNHPSGVLRPSDEDLDLTKQLAQGGQILKIDVKDHIILTREGYYSFADNGQL